ncbi:MAG TPA: hypothetical protein VNE40_03935 [Candidatus Dormibacteraeota bacterium]|nr:hypothetical protein [Candidatus Dormibacteraeota bacterium]
MRQRKKFKTGERATPAHRKSDVLSSNEFVARRKENALIQPQLIISIKEARKKLPKHLRERLTDEQVEFIIIRLQSIASEFIHSSVPQNE